MPINFPGFQPGQVPTMRPVQPVQPPGIIDPSNIIMQAAQMRQQRQLAQQKMNQEAMKNIADTIQTAQSLQEQKRQHDMQNAVAQATLGFKQGELGAESQLWGAHAQALEAQARLQDAQAKMFGMGGQNGYADSMQKIHAGLMDPDEFFHSFSSRNGMQANMLNLYNQTYPGDSLTNLKAQWAQKEQTARTAGGTNIQVPAAMAKGVEALSQDLANKAEKLGFTQYPLINKGIIAYKTAKGDPAMADYLLTNMEAQKQLSQVFSAGGAPTDFAQKSASETMKPELGPDAMRKITSATIPSMINARIGALSSIGVVGPSGMPGGQPQQTPQTGSKIRVRLKSDFMNFKAGQSGSIDPQEYDPNVMQIIQ